MMIERSAAPGQTEKAETAASPISRRDTPSPWNTAKIGVFLGHTISRLNQIEYTNHVRNRQALEEQDSVRRKPRNDAVKRSSDLEKKQPENTSDP